MGEAELDPHHRLLTIHSHIVTYGTAADSEVTNRIAEEIETLWNEPEVFLEIDEVHYRIQFRITKELNPSIDQMAVISCTERRTNFFRIEPFVHGNVSFVDAIGCNTGYFKLENLYEGSTTAAHEYGHTLGLVHPRIVDIRGEGVPGIMYPRGTLVDPQFQYDPTKPAGITGGTMHPRFRKVRTEDIDNLKLHRLSFYNLKAMVGEFTNIYHWNHAELNSPPTA